MLLATEKKVEIKKTLCYFCHQRCGLLVHVEDGKAVKVEGNPQHLFRGFTCIKGRTALEYHDHPDRLNYPLKRVGQRGDNVWRRVSWEQALDEIAGKLQEIKQQFGPEALVTAEGTHRTNIQWALRAFMHLFGTPNMISAGTICYCNTIAIHLATYGWYGATAGASTNDAACVVQWGHNPDQCYPLEFATLRRNKGRGGKVIVVDPRYTETAKLADIWLPIRPATDAALALGWLNVIINERLYDHHFVERWTVGFDELRQRVQEYPPERAAAITGLPVEKVEESARMFANTRPAFLGHGLSTDQIGRNSTQAIRAFCCLRAITGNLDVRGGERLGRTGVLREFLWEGDIDCSDRLSPEQGAKQLGSDRFRLLSHSGWQLLRQPFLRAYGHQLSTYPLSFASPMYVWEAILTGKPYPVKAFIAQGNNTLLCFANTRKVYQALKALDLLVVMDYWLTPTAMLADYALPAASWLERDDVSAVASGDMGNILIPSERAVAPLYERHTDYEFWQGLALRLGLGGGGFPWEKSLEEMWDYRLKPIGLTFRKLVEMNYLAPGGEYKKYESMGFATPSGKVELYSSILEELDYDPLPHYEEPAESPVRTPELAKEYPLLLVTSPRHLEAYHSEHRHIRTLRRQHPDPQVEIHQKVAEALGIDSGDSVYVETRRGRIRMRAKVTTEIREDVVATEHSWWFPEEPEEEPFLMGMWISNPNLLTSDELEDCDQACGGWTNRGLLCKVYKVKSYK